MKKLSILMVLLNAGIAVWMISSSESRQTSPLEQKETAADLFHPAVVVSNTIVTNPIAFRWEALESSDYKIYAQNLRKFGCPDSTLRNIITADIHGLYQKKRGMLAGNDSVKPWSSSYDGTICTREFQHLNLEEIAVIKEVLGYVPEDYPTSNCQEAETCGLRLSSSLFAKASSIKSVIKNYEVNRLMIEYKYQDSPDADSLMYAELKTIENEKNASIEKLLTPEELEDYEMRNSHSSQLLRDSLLGFEVSESEFRQLMKCRKSYDQALQNAESNSGPDFDTGWNNYMANAKKVLGNERYEAFCLSQDPEFKELYNMGMENNLSYSEIRAAWAAKQGSEQSLEPQE